MSSRSFACLLVCCSATGVSVFIGKSGCKVNISPNVGNGCVGYSMRTECDFEFNCNQGFVFYCDVVRGNKKTWQSFNCQVQIVMSFQCYLFFKRSLISPNNNSSFDGAGGGAGAAWASSAFFMRFIPLIIMKMAKATMMKSKVVWTKFP